VAATTVGGDPAEAVSATTVGGDPAEAVAARRAAMAKNFIIIVRKYN
jgi:hypothetical protein